MTDKAMPWCPRCGGYHFDGCNPRGWNEPGMQPITWAEIEPFSGQRAKGDTLRQLTDHVLEETFQSWLKASTLPSNAEQYRKQLRRRISLMVEKAWKVDSASVSKIVDLSGLV